MNNILEVIQRKKEQSPQYEYMFRVELPSLEYSRVEAPAMLVDSFVRNTLSQSGANTVNSTINMSMLHHRVSAVDAPFTTFEPSRHVRGSGHWYKPNHCDQGQLTLTMDEMEDGLTMRYISEWLSLIRNEDGTYNPPIVYKKPVRVIRLTSSGRDIHISEYQDYFPVEVAPISYNYEGSSILQYRVSLSGDNIKHKILSVNEVNRIIQEAQPDILRKQSFDKFRITDDTLAAVGSLINKGLILF